MSTDRWRPEAEELSLELERVLHRHGGTLPLLLRTWQKHQVDAILRLVERVQPQWLPIETAPKDRTLVLVALIRDGVVWRVSDAAFNGLGWYTKSGEACHWRTHWAPLAGAVAASPSGERQQETSERVPFWMQNARKRQQEDGQ